MKPFLSEAAQSLLHEERRLLEKLRALLARLDADDARVARLDEVVASLGELFLVVIVGEFNAGKSSVVNALFGEKLMEEGPIPTTAKVTLVRHGEAKMERQLSAWLVERRYPSDLLQNLSLVDTPGTNSIVEAHQKLTEDFIPRADLVLFVTSYDRPLTHSERQFLQYIRGVWGKRLVFVLNKADLARSEADLAQVIEHIKSGSAEQLGFTPEVFPVSAVLAYESKTNPSEVVRETLWKQSLFAGLEAFVRDTLGGPERLALKLQGPLDAAGALLDGLRAPLETRREGFRQDERTLATLNAQLDTTRDALRDQYQRPLAEVDRLLDEVEARGVQFLNDSLRATNIGLLRDKDRFKEEFSRQVVRDLDRQIEVRVTDGVDDIIRRAMELWRGTLESLRSQSIPANPGGLGGPDRAAIFDRLMREAGRKLETHDVQEEARRILENARNSADMFKYAGVGAVGLGALSGILVVTTALDALGGLGLLTAGALGVLSFTFLPAQRRKAITEFHSRMDALRADLRRALQAEFERTVEAVTAGTRETLRPFADSVQHERETLEVADREIATLKTDVQTLRERVHEDVGETTVG